MRMPLITGINDYAWELHVVGNKFNEGSKVYETEVKNDMANPP